MKAPIYTLVATTVVIGLAGCSAVQDDFEYPLHLAMASEGASAPTTAVDPGNDAVYFSWFGKDEDGRPAVYAASSQRDDSTASTPVRVNPVDVSVNPHPQAPAQIAVSLEGAVYVAWSTREEIPGRRFPASNLMLAGSRDGGRTFQSPVFVNDDARGAPAGHTFHDLAIGPDGTIYVSWLDSREPETVHLADEAGDSDYHHGDHDTADAHDSHSGHSTTDVRVARSTDGGQTFSTGVVVAQNTCQCCRTAIFIDNVGTVYLAWRQIYEDNIRDIAFASSSDGARSFSEPTRVHTDGWKIEGCPHTGPSLAVGADGTIHVSWYTAADSTTGLRYAVSSDGGRHFTEPLALESGIPVASARLAVSNRIPVWVAWEDPRADQICAAPAGGSPDNSDRKVTFAGSAPAISVTDRVRSVVWQHKGGIEALVIRHSETEPRPRPNV